MREDAWSDAPGPDPTGEPRPGSPGDRFVELLGIRFGEVSATRVSASLEVEPRHHQPYGIVHGGVYATIVETLASYGAAISVYDRGMLAVGVANTTDFLRPHRAGRLDAVAEPIHQGRTQQLWQVTITRAADGKPVARGQVRLQNVAVDQLTGGA